MLMAHLKRSAATGHLLRGVGGHLVNTCPPVCDTITVLPDADVTIAGEIPPCNPYACDASLSLARNPSHPSFTGCVWEAIHDCGSYWGWWLWVGYASETGQWLAWYEGTFGAGYYTDETGPYVVLVDGVTQDITADVWVAGGKLLGAWTMPLLGGDPSCVAYVVLS